MVELHSRPHHSYQDNGSSIRLHLTHIEPGHCISCRSSTGYGVGLKENTADPSYVCSNTLTISFTSALAIGIQRASVPSARWRVYVLALAVICSKLATFTHTFVVPHALAPNFSEAFGTVGVISSHTASIPWPEVGVFRTIWDNADLAHAIVGIECIALIALRMNNFLARLD